MSQEHVESTPADDDVAGQGGTPTAEQADQQAEQVMDLLSEHVPLSLIMDLSSPAGPDSEQILEAEGEPEDAWWEPTGDAKSSSSDGA